MAFVVEDGTGLPDATSLLSVADADAYHVGHPDEAVWVAFTEPQKQARLNMASARATHLAKWNGSKLLTTQALAWPRTGVYDAEQQLIPSSSVPAAVGYGIAELARRLAERAVVLGTSHGAVIAESVGPLSYTYANAGRDGVSLYGFPTAVIEWWLPMLDTVRRLMRA